MTSFRGSRLHVLEWVEQSTFAEDMKAILDPVPISFPANAFYMPRGRSAPREARLESFGPRVLPGLADWKELRSWWLRHPQGANTPNWDIASPCTIENRLGILLVEAKANKPELSRAGKSPPKRRKPYDPAPSQRSLDNHAGIAAAIAMANAGLAVVDPQIRLSRDSHYQLSNRMAFGWWLASHGVPTIVLYLGFLGDYGITDAGEPLADTQDWLQCFDEYCLGIVPLALRERRLDLGLAPLWVLARSRPVLSQSPTPRSS